MVRSTSQELRQLQLLMSNPHLRETVTEFADRFICGGIVHANGGPILRSSIVRRLHDKRDAKHFHQLHEDVHATNRIGKWAEKKFEKMVGLLMACRDPDWLVECRHATRREDKRLGFDFELTCLDSSGGQFEMKFQVKFSWHGAKKFQSSHPNSDIHVIVMKKVGASNNFEWLKSNLEVAWRKEMVRRGMRPVHPSQLDWPSS